MGYDVNDELGSDFRCLTDITPNLSLCSGVDCLTDALARRLQSFLWHDDGYGYPLITAINAPVNASTSQVARAIEAQLSLDERVDRVTAEVSWDESSSTLTITVSGTAVTGEEFEFVGSIRQGYSPTFTR